MSRIEKLRGGWYVDGFNLYHALDEVGQPHLKWLNLWRLAERMSRGHAHSVDRVVFGTAFFPGDFNKRKRHESYNAALEAYSVEVKLGHTTKEPMDCKGCGRRWDQPREKETDINVALSLFNDARLELIDVAFLVTADTDQAATLKFMRNCFPEKKLVVVTPPGRKKSAHLRDIADANLQIKVDDLDACIFPPAIQPKEGRLITQPKEYAPPKGWVHPDKRP